MPAAAHARTTTELDEGWLLEERPPSSGFEEAFWGQVEGKALKHNFGEPSPKLMTEKPLRRRRTYM